MSGPVAMSKAYEIAKRVEARGFTVPLLGILAVGEDGHVKMTIKGLPETWDALLATTPHITDTTGKPAWVLGEDDDGMFLYQPAHEDDYSFPIHVPRTDPVGEMEKARDALNNYPALAAACAGVPAEALTPGSVKLLVDALEAELVLDTHLAKCKLCDVDGFCEEGEVISEAGTALRHKALAPFKGTQEVKPNAETPT